MLSRGGASGSAAGERKSEGRGLFASLVSAAAEKGRKLSLVRIRVARASAGSTVPLNQQGTLSSSATVSHSPR